METLVLAAFGAIDELMADLEDFTPELARDLSAGVKRVTRSGDMLHSEVM